MSDIPRQNKWLFVLAALLVICLSAFAGWGGAYLALSRQPGAPVAGEAVPGGLYRVMPAAAGGGESGALSIPEIVELAAPSVVEITTETVKTDLIMRQYISGGAGSGVIIRSDGYIVTNNHVIEGARRISVTTQDGRNFEAKVVGKDPQTDLAVVKIEASGLRPAVFGDSDKLVVGELAVAIGNPLGELGGTVTEGIISALNRDIIIDGQAMNLLQTSAAINPGNSGGGLFNNKGELIGIVNAKSSGLGIEGIGFAIPSNIVQDIVGQLMEHGYVRGRVEVGVTLVDIADVRAAMLYGVPRLGVYVINVFYEDTGFKPGDRIVSVEGKEINSIADFKGIISRYKVGDKLRVVVQRGWNLIELQVPLREAQGQR
ncbi:MAG TPA: trypsin-like serine protease [Clostridia bacterium]|nr:trypsin-like serine protease [Clostridia bacterium]